MLDAGKIYTSASFLTLLPLTPHTPQESRITRTTLNKLWVSFLIWHTVACVVQTDDQQKLHQHCSHGRLFMRRCPGVLSVSLVSTFIISVIVSVIILKYFSLDVDTLELYVLVWFISEFLKLDTLHEIWF